MVLKYMSSNFKSYFFQSQKIQIQLIPTFISEWRQNKSLKIIMNRIYERNMPTAVNKAVQLLLYLEFISICHSIYILDMRKKPLKYPIKQIISRVQFYKWQNRARHCAKDCKPIVLYHVSSQAAIVFLKGEVILMRSRVLFCRFFSSLPCQIIDLFDILKYNLSY